MRLGCGTAVIPLGALVSSSDFPTPRMNILVSFFPKFFFEFHVYLLVLHLPVALSTFPFLLAMTFCQAHTGDNSNSKQCGVKTNPFSHSENKPLSPFSLSFLLSLPQSSLFSLRENKLLTTLFILHRKT